MYLQTGKWKGLQDQAYIDSLITFDFNYGGSSQVTITLALSKSLSQDDENQGKTLPSVLF